MYQQQAQPTVVVVKQGNAANWITAGCSVATLGIVGFTAMKVMEQTEKVSQKVEVVTNPGKTIRNKFFKKEKQNGLPSAK